MDIGTSLGYVSYIIVSDLRYMKYSVESEVHWIHNIYDIGKRYKTHTICFQYYCESSGCSLSLIILSDTDTETGRYKAADTYQ
jgi:hypothetical protein